MPDADTSALCYFERLGSPDATGRARFSPTGRVAGAWNTDEQHLSPIAGLLAHALDRHQERPDLQLARISYDVLGTIPMDVVSVGVRIVRPGRTIELLEATADVAGRTVVRAQAWRLVRHDTAAIAGGWPPRLPEPAGLPELDLGSVWPGAYIASLECRQPAGSLPGRGQAWVRSDVALLTGEEVSPTADFLRLVDTANGVAVRADPRDWMFPNVDLSVHLYRRPVPGWIGFDTTVAIGPDGLGLTASHLHDETGPVGRVEQMLTVRAGGIR